MEVEEESEQIQDGMYKPVQADCFDGSKEGLADWKSQSLNCAELGEERCCNFQFHQAQFTRKLVMSFDLFFFCLVLDHASISNIS